MRTAPLWFGGMAAGSFAAGVAWLAVASALVTYLTTAILPGHTLPWSLELWLEVLPYRNTNWRVFLVVVASAAIPSLFLLMIVAGVWRQRAARNKLTARPLPGQEHSRPLVRGSSNNHGDADWLPMATAKRELQPAADGSPYMVIGEAWRVDQSAVANVRYNPRDPASWGRGGKEPLLCDPCDSGPTHSMIFGGSGSGKTTSSITRALHWKGPLVVLDPSSEIGPMIAQARADMGDEVIVVGPGRLSTDVLAGINPNAPNAVRRLLSAVASICGDEPDRGENQIFSNAGRNLVACILGHILWDDCLPRRMRTLMFFRELITTPQFAMKKLLAGIVKTTKCTTSRLLAGTLTDLPDETFGGAYFNATQMTSWLFDDALVEALSTPQFVPSDIVKRPMSVFVQVAPDVLETTPQVARVIIETIAWEFIEADGHYHERTLMMVDEASKLGRMRALQIVRDVGRKYGLTLCLMYLSEAEVTNVWGQHGLAEWMATISWRAYSAITDRDTAKGVSADAGNMGVIAVSEGDNEGQSGKTLEKKSNNTGKNTSMHEIKRALIHPDELRRMRRDELIVFFGELDPIRCSQPAYFRRPEVAERVAHNRFNRSNAA